MTTPTKAENPSDPATVAKGLTDDISGLAYFHHHPEPEIDFEIEVEALFGILESRRLGIPGKKFDEDNAALPYRLARAVDYRTINPVSLNTKAQLRKAIIAAGFILGEMRYEGSPLLETPHAE